MKNPDRQENLLDLSHSQQEMSILLDLMARFLLHQANERDLTILCENPIDLTWGCQSEWNQFYDCAAEVLKNSQYNLAALGDDYLQLLIGFGMPAAPPWGSVYLNEEHLLKQHSTQNLMLFLRDHSIYFTQAENEPVDHIGYCLQALSLLLQRADHSQVVSEFLTLHLLPWVGRFITLGKARAQTNFYRLLIVLLESILNQLSQIYQVILKPTRLYY